MVVLIVSVEFSLGESTWQHCEGRELVLYVKISS